MLYMIKTIMIIGFNIWIYFQKKENMKYQLIGFAWCLFILIFFNLQTIGLSLGAI